MLVTVKDKRLKALMGSKPGQGVKGLQPAEVTRIRVRIDTLLVLDTLTQVADNHPEWRVHEWKGHKGFWSIDVLANTRLLFLYDGKAHEVRDMVYDDPH